MTRLAITEHVVPGRRLGRHVHHDHRSLAYPVAVLPSSQIRSVQWRRRCDPFDQGELGSCTGNAMAGLLMTGPFYEDGRDLTEKEAVSIYSDATKIDQFGGTFPPDDTGSSGLAVARVAHKRGLIRGYRHAFSIQAALAALQSGPVITGVPWYAGFDTPEGDQAVVSVSGDVRGGHEFVVDGIDVDAGLVFCTNSWGTEWGNRGRFAMTFATWKELLRQRGDVTVALRL